MARNPLLAALTASALCLTTAALARQDAAPNTPPPTARLWTFGELKSHLDNRDLRILDARSEEAYRAGHIPGAVRVDVAAAEKLAGAPGGLANAEAWTAWATPLGIGPNTEIVVYDDNRQLAAARVWWLLTYLGVEKAGLLDGGYKLWAASEMPTTTEERTAAQIPFNVRFRIDRHATRADVLASLNRPGSQILDVRSPAEYAGTAKISKRSGHIPSACNLEWKTLVLEDGRFVAPDDARDLLGAARLDPAKTVVTHCQGGGRASVSAFMLERLGYSTRNYYASWGDWGNADDTPIEGETKPE